MCKIFESYLNKFKFIYFKIKNYFYKVKLLLRIFYFIILILFIIYTFYNLSILRINFYGFWILKDKKENINNEYSYNLKEIENIKKEIEKEKRGGNKEITEKLKIKLATLESQNTSLKKDLDSTEAKINNFLDELTDGKDNNQNHIDKGSNKKNNIKWTLFLLSCCFALINGILFSEAYQRILKYRKYRDTQKEWKKIYREYKDYFSNPDGSHTNNSDITIKYQRIYLNGYCRGFIAANSELYDATQKLVYYHVLNHYITLSRVNNQRLLPN